MSGTNRWHCTESVTGHGLTDRDGKCPWCGIKTESKMSRLAPQIGATTDIDDSYEYFWDPDYGIPK